MPRPTRIQYENAFYHVMNRGRGRQKIFHGKVYYQAFLKTLGESHERFDAVIHAYCLMGNHYHLLIETPRANLDRIMRHINGVYTQRYNRLQKTDGPLFRGRYKSILIDEDAYLMQVSRYIHRNPVEIKGVDDCALKVYPWSSYLAYINKATAQSWLQRDKTYQLLDLKQRFSGYREFVEAGVDEAMLAFYDKKNIAGVLGDLAFKERLVDGKEKLKVSGDLSAALSVRPSIESIIIVVANVFAVSMFELTHKKGGRQKANMPRKFAIYCAQQLGDVSLKSIANVFELQHEGSASASINTIRKCLDEGELVQQLNLVKKQLNVIK